MFYTLKADKPGWILTVTTCPSFGLRPQVSISKTKIKKHGGLDTLKTEANKQALDRDRPIAFVDHIGQFVFKSDNWPKPTK